MLLKQAKNTVPLERILLKEIRELKIFCKAYCRVHKHFMEPGNSGHTHTLTHTHTQSEYRNPCVHVRRALISYTFGSHLTCIQKDYKLPLTQVGM